MPDEKVHRFAACYRRDAGKKLVLIDDPQRSGYRKEPSFLSGGGGLVSTTTDYLRFCQMLLAGGELDGVRILGRKTIELMTSNHLPGDGEEFVVHEFAAPREVTNHILCGNAVRCGGTETVPLLARPLCY